MTRVDAPGCRWTDDGPMLATHLPSCTSAGCEGCAPCPEFHCAGRRHCVAHVPAEGASCPLEVAKARHAVETIADLSCLLLPAAITDGRVTGEAANLAGPAPNPHRLVERHIELKAADLRDWIEDDDPHHPFAVLGRWAMMTRDSLGLAPQRVFTVSAFADHLLAHLHELAADELHGFPAMLKELRACRRHLESVLRNSHDDETGAPCPKCSEPGKPGPNLEHRHSTWGADGKRCRACTSGASGVEHSCDTSGASDFWRCPRCRGRWSEADYRLRVGREARHHLDRLTAAQIHETYRVLPGTLRKWAHEGRVAKLGRNGEGKMLYRVRDVLAAREAARAAPVPDEAG